MGPSSKPRGIVDLSTGATLLAEGRAGRWAETGSWQVLVRRCPTRTIPLGEPCTSRLPTPGTLPPVTDVLDGSGATGRPNSIKLSTANGHICYLCDSETAQVGRGQCAKWASCSVAEQLAAGLH